MQVFFYQAPSTAAEPSFASTEEIRGFPSPTLGDRITRSGRDLLFPAHGTFLAAVPAGRRSVYRQRPVPSREGHARSPLHLSLGYRPCLRAAHHLCSPLRRDKSRGYTRSCPRRSDCVAHAQRDRFRQYRRSKFIAWQRLSGESSTKMCEDTHAAATDSSPRSAIFAACRTAHRHSRVVEFGLEPQACVGSASMVYSSRDWILLFLWKSRAPSPGHRVRKSTTCSAQVKRESALSGTTARIPTRLVCGPNPETLSPGGGELHEESAKLRQPPDPAIDHSSPPSGGECLVVD